MGALGILTIALLDIIFLPIQLLFIKPTQWLFPMSPPADTHMLVYFDETVPRGNCSIERFPYNTTKELIFQRVQELSEFLNQSRHGTEMALSICPQSVFVCFDASLHRIEWRGGLWDESGMLCTPLHRVNDGYLQQLLASMREKSGKEFIFVRSELAPEPEPEIEPMPEKVEKVRKESRRNGLYPSASWAPSKGLVEAARPVKPAAGGIEGVARYSFDSLRNMWNTPGEIWNRGS